MPHVAVALLLQPRGVGVFLPEVGQLFHEVQLVVAVVHPRGEVVHLADSEGRVPGFGQPAREGRQRVVVDRRVAVAEIAVTAAGQARQQVVPRRHADRVRSDRVGTVAALGHQPVEIGREHVPVACGGDGVEALLIGEEEQDVGTVGHGAALRSGATS